MPDRTKSETSREDLPQFPIRPPGTRPSNPIQSRVEAVQSRFPCLSFLTAGCNPRSAAEAWKPPTNTHTCVGMQLQHVCCSFPCLRILRNHTQVAPKSARLTQHPIHAMAFASPFRLRIPLAKCWDPIPFSQRWTALMPRLKVSGEYVEHGSLPFSVIPGNLFGVGVAMFGALLCCLACFTT